MHSRSAPGGVSPRSSGSPPPAAPRSPHVPGMGAPRAHGARASTLRRSTRHLPRFTWRTRQHASPQHTASTAVRMAPAAARSAAAHGLYRGSHGARRSTLRRSTPASTPGRRHLRSGRRAARRPSRLASRRPLALSAQGLYSCKMAALRSPAPGREAPAPLVGERYLWCGRLPVPPARSAVGVFPGDDPRPCFPQ